MILNELKIHRCVCLVYRLFIRNLKDKSQDKGLCMKHKRQGLDSIKDVKQDNLSTILQ